MTTPLTNICGVEWLRFADAHNLPPLDFVFPGLLAGTVGLMVGPGGIGKTLLALAIGAGVPLGANIGCGPSGELFKAPVRGPAAIVFGEDPPAVVRHREAAFRTCLSPDDISVLDGPSGLGVASWHGRDMRVLDASVRPYVRGPWFDTLRSIATGRRLVILDPLAFLHSGDEKDNCAMGLLMQSLSTIAHESGAAILVLHHSGKGAGDGRDEWARSRGASVLTTAVRVQYDLRGPTDQEAKALGIADEDRWYWCRFATVKINYDRPQKPVWLSRSGPGGLLLRDEPKVGPLRDRSQTKVKQVRPANEYWEKVG